MFSALTQALPHDWARTINHDVRVQATVRPSLPPSPSLMPHLLTLMILLTTAWMLWSGPYTLHHGLLQVFAVGSILGTLWLTLRMEKSSGEPSRWPNPLRLALYLPWFTLEVVKSAWDVTRIVLSRDMPMSPRMVRVKATQKTDFGKAIYANSITLTPGTITLDVRGDILLVHALTKETAEGVETGVMDAKVTAFEGAAPSAGGDQ